MSSTNHYPGLLTAVVLRTFGFLHLGFALFGLWLVIPHLLARDPSSHSIVQSAPYVEQVFLVRSAINVAFLLVQLVAGVNLVALRETGIRITNLLFASMILYSVVHAVVSMTGDGPIRNSISISSAAGEIGIAWQFFTGYPLIALVVLNLVARKLRRRTEVGPA